MARTKGNGSYGVVTFIEESLVTRSVQLASTRQDVKKAAKAHFTETTFRKLSGERSYDRRFTILALAYPFPPSNPKSYLRMCGSRKQVTGLGSVKRFYLAMVTKRVSGEKKASRFRLAFS
jgi:hypothetical protein